MLQINAFLSFGGYVSGRGVGRQILAKAARSPKVLQMNAFLSFGGYVSGWGVGRQILAKAFRSLKVLLINAFLSFGGNVWPGRRPPDLGQGRPEPKSAPN